LEFPKFDGDNPMGWLRQAEKCFTLAETPEYKKVKFAEVFLVGKIDHCLEVLVLTPTLYPGMNFLL
jgi:hypothetical protein